MTVAHHGDIADVCAFVNFQGITPFKKSCQGNRLERGVPHVSPFLRDVGTARYSLRIFDYGGSHKQRMRVGRLRVKVEQLPET